jgi:hypothetical protein
MPSSASLMRSAPHCCELGRLQVMNQFVVVHFNCGRALFKLDRKNCARYFLRWLP